MATKKEVKIQKESKIQKSFKFGADTYQNNAASLGKLVKAVKAAPARLDQAISWLVSAALEQTQWNQSAPLQQAATMLVFSEQAVLKKAGKKLLDYCKAEVETLELVVIKNSEVVKVKYLALEGARDLPDDLPPFSGWNPAESTPAPKAVTAKAVETMQKAFQKRQQYLLLDADTVEKAEEEKYALESSLINMLIELMPVTELVKRVTDSEDSVDTLTKALEHHKAAILAAKEEEEVA